MYLIEALEVNQKPVRKTVSQANFCEKYSFYKSVNDGSHDT